MDILDKLLDNLFWIIIGVSSAVGVFFAAKRRKKEGPTKVQELVDHLNTIGISAQNLNPELYQPTQRGRKSWSDKTLGSITISRQAIESIEVIGVTQQYGVNYYLDFVVPISNMSGFVKMKKTKMTKKNVTTYAGKTTSVEWKGDQELASRLNFDESLKNRVVATGLTDKKEGIVISPDTKKQLTTIRTSYTLPTKDQFDVIDAIAKHVKSIW